MAFSAELIARIAEEAAAQGLNGATQITVAIREQLVESKRGGRDHRTKDYFVAGRVVDRGNSILMPGVVQIVGLDSLSDRARDAAAFAGITEPMAPDCAKPFIGSARVSMTRNGNAHLTVLLPHSKQPPAKPDAWVDLWVYRKQTDAAAHAATLKPGKIF